MFKQIGAGEIILVLAVLLLLFGAKKLPELARSLGKSARELRKGMRESDDAPGAAENGEHPNGEASPRPPV